MSSIEEDVARPAVAVERIATALELIVGRWNDPTPDTSGIPDASGFGEGDLIAVPMTDTARYGAEYRTYHAVIYTADHTGRPHCAAKAEGPLSFGEAKHILDVPEVRRCHAVGCVRVFAEWAASREADARTGMN